ncbi:DUF3318 domain-containing protein [Trinickia fusca]|uniref:DUF3318 domain-containing protein n=2 Tax=Trinickia fusca TaxID=2419777 RepID=A0A494XKY3_9BURK|nr:DUF3318 domain-containing protein [Trinickia fusca]RKP51268.1 DUF3318 domain-containing protein [Trinickia fusca]
MSTPQLRAVRKELLLLRADVERAEFIKARTELSKTFTSFGWLKLLVPGFVARKAKGSGKGINTSLSEWVANHPLASSLASMILGKPLRAALRAGAKPLLKWGALGAAGFAAYRLWRQFAHRDHGETGADADAKADTGTTSESTAS